MLKFISQLGVTYLNDGDNVTSLPTDSPLWLAMEQEFDQWIEGANPAGEYQDKYFGDDAIYTKSGAIEQAIGDLINWAEEENRKIVTHSDLKKYFDAAASFE